MEPKVSPLALESFTENDITYSYEPIPVLGLTKPFLYRWFHYPSESEGQKTIYCTDRVSVLSLVNFWNAISQAAWKFFVE